VGSVPARAGIALALLPLVFTGKAMLLGRLYGPSDLYYVANPWKRIAARDGVGAPVNPILSDLAFANLPWRAAVKEAVANGRTPLWNRFVLAGSPLLPAAQAGILHPATWLGLALPVPLSWTFSCTFTLFLALVCAFLFFRDLELTVVASLTGAVAWGFSTYVLFWVGWSVGPSTASFPLLLLGLRRLARSPGRPAIALTAAAFWLSVCGGHPESAFHSAAAGAVFFLWELLPRRGIAAARSLCAVVGSAVLALLLCAPQILPLLETIPHSAEYRARRETLRRSAGRQSVRLPEAARRLLPDLLPFSHGIYGKSPVQSARADGSGMPLGYSGAVLFPLALLAFRSSAARRERTIFVVFWISGLLYGASAPGLMDLTARLPGFALALNYRLVFLAGLGLAGLAALGVHALQEAPAPLHLAVACSICAALLLAICLWAVPTLQDRSLAPRFVWTQLALEVVPLFLLALVASLVRPSAPRLAFAALLLLVAQRGAEMAGTYPTLPASTLAPPLPTLASLPMGSEPCRIVAEGETLRPNGAALYGLEDVRGYESLVLARFTDTYPLWSQPQAASFNRVTDLTSPFLAFLNACYAIGAPEDPVPRGWREQARGAEMSIFQNPAALPRAFVPRRLRRVADPRERIRELARAVDFSEVAWLSEAGAGEEGNGEATLTLRASGPDLVLEVRASARTLVATSIPDWPGWVAEEDGRPLSITTANHAFVGFWVPPGRHSVRLAYRPASWGLGLAAGAAGVLAAVALAIFRRRTP
jgi:hypothetical protein